MKRKYVPLYQGYYVIDNSIWHQNPIRIVHVSQVNKPFKISDVIVSGSFENVTFSNNSFFDASEFKNCTFFNCKFEDISMRCCKFFNCKFVNCIGTIRYIRKTTFRKDCSFENSSIKIQQIDEYYWNRGFRHKSNWSNTAEFVLCDC